MAGAGGIGYWPFMVNVVFRTPEAPFLPLRRRARQMRAMMERLGLEPGRIHGRLGGTAIEGAASLCIACQNALRCRAWLAAGTEPDGYLGFCPNAGLFDRLTGPPGRPD